MKNHTCRVAWILIGLALTASQSFAQSTYEPYTFTTLAGGGGFVSPDEMGSAARFKNPNGVAVDRAGNVYVADFYLDTIRKGYPALMILNSAFNVASLALASQGRWGSWGSWKLRPIW